LGRGCLRAWWQRKPSRSRSKELNEVKFSDEKTSLRLESASPLKGWAIRVAGRGSSRQARDKEAAALLIGALATVAENSGVKTLNLINTNGRPVALAIIEDARFEEEYGETILSPVIGLDNE
jgi:hypothetical protein